MYERHYVAHRHGSRLHQEQQRLPWPGPIAPASTCDTTYSANRARYFSVTNTGQTVSSRFDLPAAGTNQTSPLPPGPVTLARSEQQELRTAPSQVSYLPRLRKLQAILACEGWENTVWPSNSLTALHGCYGPLQLFRKAKWFIGETNLLACYDLFSYLVIKQLPRFVYMQFGWREGDKFTTGGKSVVFRRCKFCFVHLDACHKMSSEICSWTLN
jgi:hypothetical protein